MMRWLLLPCGLAVSVGLLLIGFSRAGDDKIWNTVATKAIDFLKGTQQDNGAVTDQDINRLLAWLMVSAVIVVLFNLVADLLYAFLDPRIRYA